MLSHGHLDRDLLAGAAGASDRSSSRYQLMVFSGDNVHTFNLPDSGTVTIGRGGSATVHIDNPSVSRNHAVLHVDADRLELEDLGSANGTLLREKAGSAASSAETLNVHQLRGGRASLTIGDCILLGTASVVVRHTPSVALPDLSSKDASVVIRAPAMRAIHEQASLAARSLINVLILGETGVGKEVLARGIHAHSRRSTGPFIAINCAALSESLQESELFGHEKGAFTGAAQARPGLFEVADRGTVFLDEVGELSAGAQAKLLRVLAERQITRVGGHRSRPIDVRLVAATNRDVEAESQGGRFRPDLFFRLNGMSLLIPPLRDRLEEIEPLAQMFLAATCREIERAQPPILSAEVAALFRRYPWPGNVRELRNVIQRAVILCLGGSVLPGHLPASLLERAGGVPSLGRARRSTSVWADASPEQPAPAREWTGDRSAGGSRQGEEARIIDALEQHAGNQTRAAKALGMSRRTLITRLERYGIPRPRLAGRPAP